MKLFVITFIAHVILIYLGFTVLHEEAHSAIYKQTTCKETKVSYLKGYAQCVEYKDNYSKEDKLQEQYLNSMNEIVGYNVQTIFMAMFGCLVCLVSYLEKKQGVVKNG